MRRYIPALLLALAAIAPFPLAGCDLITKLKGGGGEDAASDAAVAAPEVDAAEAAPVAETDAETATLDAAVPTTVKVVKPVVVDAAATVDAAVPVVVDASAPTVTDSGVAPAPTPTLRLPRGLLDGGLFRIDAGGLKLPR
jgi:hypothetical protein